MINIPVYNQSDTQWKNKLLGTSGKTFGMWGCLVTCLAMALNNFAKSLNPGQVCDKLNLVKGFDEYGNLLLKDGVEAAFTETYFRKNNRVYTTLYPQANIMKMNIDAALVEIKKLVKLGLPVAINVDLVGSDKNPDHWVLVVDTDFTIHDPAFGERVSITKRYGMPDKAIYGFTYWNGSPISFPDDGLPDVGQTAFKLAQAERGINVKLNISESLDSLT